MLGLSYSPVSTSALPDDDRGFRRQLYIIIFEADTPAGKAFDVALLVAILISVIAVVLESVPHLHHHYALIFRLSEYMFTSTFTVEYLIRLLVAPSASAYACSFFGLVDAASILPTFLELLLPGASSLRVVRVLRLLRVFQVLHMTGFINDAVELKHAFWAAR
jgi:voltage-gated potassium channel